MPSFKITDGMNGAVDIIPSADSGVSKYFKNLSNLSLDGALLALQQGVSLDDPAVRTVTAGVNFANPVDVGIDQVDLKIGAGVNGSLGIFKPNATGSQLFDPDPYGDPIQVAQNDRYVSFGFDANVNPAATVGSGDLKFGFSTGASISITNYRRFATAPSSPELLDAVTSTIGGFVVPAGIEDLGVLPVGSVVTLDGTGSLKVSVTASLLAAVNPLASASLPAPVPSVVLKAGESISVGAEILLSGEYQVRVVKTAERSIRLAYYRKSGSSFSIKATAEAGIAAQVGDNDILGRLISAVSSDAKADADELKGAGLSPDQIGGIQETIKASIARTIEVAVSAELGRSGQQTAAFVYDISLDSLSSQSRTAIHQALRGDLGLLNGGKASSLPGIRAVRDIFETLNESQHALTINLIGIVNYGRISKLILVGRTLYEPSTGQLIITDTATASRIATTVMNIGVADAEKLRQVMAENFLITIAYRVAKTVGLQPSITTSHSFFALNEHTSPDTVQDELDVSVGLGLMTTVDRDRVVNSAPDFGRTLFSATTTYDEALSTQLFLDGDEPKTLEFFEGAGLDALKCIVQPGDVDEARLRPTTNAGLWRKMKDLGQPTLPVLFKDVPAPVIAAIVSDYTVIRWWSDAMRATGEKLAEMRKFLATHLAVNDQNNDFKNLRNELAAHLRSVAATTKEEFGKPWGLLAMFNASGKKCGRKTILVGRNLSIVKETPIGRAVTSAIQQG